MNLTIQTVQHEATLIFLFSNYEYDKTKTRLSKRHFVLKLN